MKNKLQKILIASSNIHKQKKLKKIVKDFFKPIVLTLPRIKETGQSLQKIAEYKAKKYSKWFNGWAIATDAGARIPALKKWNSLRTKRFIQGNDFKRMDVLLKTMKNKGDRMIFWDEALAVAYNGKTIFSTIVSGMPAQIQRFYDFKKYKKGHWLDSLCSFQQFNNKNFFDLTSRQKLETENSWAKLEKEFLKFFKKPENLIEK